jgi:hypothetical protein
MAYEEESCNSEIPHEEESHVLKGVSSIQGESGAREVDWIPSPAKDVPIASTRAYFSMVSQSRMKVQSLFGWWLIYKEHLRGGHT